MDDETDFLAWIESTTGVKVDTAPPPPPLPCTTTTTATATSRRRLRRSDTSTATAAPQADTTKSSPSSDAGDEDGGDESTTPHPSGAHRRRRRTDAFNPVAEEKRAIESKLALATASAARTETADDRRVLRAAEASLSTSRDSIAALIRRNEPFPCELFGWTEEEVERLRAELCAAASLEANHLVAMGAGTAAARVSAFAAGRIAEPPRTRVVPSISDLIEAGQTSVDSTDSLRGATLIPLFLGTSLLSLQALRNGGVGGGGGGGGGGGSTLSSSTILISSVENTNNIAFANAIINISNGSQSSIHDLIHLLITSLPPDIAKEASSGLSLSPINVAELLDTNWGASCAAASVGGTTTAATNTTSTMIDSGKQQLLTSPTSSFYHTAPVAPTDSLMVTSSQELHYTQNSPHVLSSPQPQQTALLTSQTLKNCGLSPAAATGAVWHRCSTALFGDIISNEGGGGGAGGGGAPLLLARLHDVGLGAGYGLQVLPSLIAAAATAVSSATSNTTMNGEALSSSSINLPSTPNTDLIAGEGAYASWVGFVDVLFDSNTDTRSRVGAALTAAGPAHSVARAPAGTVDGIYLPLSGATSLASGQSFINTIHSPLEALCMTPPPRPTTTAPLQEKQHPVALTPPLGLVSFLAGLLALGAGDALIREGLGGLNGDAAPIAGLSEALATAARLVITPMPSPMNATYLEDAIALLADTIAVSVGAHALALLDARPNMPTTSLAPQASTPNLGLSPGVFFAPLPRYALSSSSLTALAVITLRLCLDPIAAGQGGGAGGPGCAPWIASDPARATMETTAATNAAWGDASWRTRDNSGWQSGLTAQISNHFTKSAATSISTSASAGQKSTPALSALIRLLSTVCDVLALRSALADARDNLAGRPTARAWPTITPTVKSLATTTAVTASLSTSSAVPLTDTTSSSPIIQPNSSAPGWVILVAGGLVKWGLPGIGSIFSTLSPSPPPPPPPPPAPVPASSSIVSTSSLVLQSLSPPSRKRRTMVVSSDSESSPTKMNNPTLTTTAAAANITANAITAATISPPHLPFHISPPPPGSMCIGTPGTCIIALSQASDEVNLGNVLCDLGVDALGAVIEICLPSSTTASSPGTVAALEWKRGVLTGWFPEGIETGSGEGSDQYADDDDEIDFTARAARLARITNKNLRSGGKGGNRNSGGGSGIRGSRVVCEGSSGSELFLTHTLTREERRQPHHMVTWIDPLTVAPPRCARGIGGICTGAAVRLNGTGAPRVRLALSPLSRAALPLDVISLVDFECGWAWVGSYGWIDWLDIIAVESALSATAENAARTALQPPTLTTSATRAAAASLLPILEAAQADSLGGLARIPSSTTTSTTTTAAAAANTTTTTTATTTATTALSVAMRETSMSFLSSHLLSPARAFAARRLARTGLAVDESSDRLRLAYPRIDALSALIMLLSGVALGRDATAIEPKARSTTSANFGALGASVSLPNRVFCEPRTNDSLWLAFTPVSSSRAPLAALARRLSFLTLHAITVSGEHNETAVSTLWPHDKNITAVAAAASQRSPLKPPPLTPKALLTLSAALSPQPPDVAGDISRRAAARRAAHWQRLTAATIALRVSLALEWTYIVPENVVSLSDNTIIQRAQTATARAGENEPIHSRGIPSVALLSFQAPAIIRAPRLASFPLTHGPTPELCGLFLKGGLIPESQPGIHFIGLNSWIRSVTFDSPISAKYWRSHVSSLTDLLKVCDENE